MTGREGYLHGDPTNDGPELDLPHQDPTPVEPSLDEHALEAARLAVEDCLVEFRDAGISMPFVGNGMVIRGRDGSDSSIIRLPTRAALSIGIGAYLKAMKERTDG